MHLHMQEIDGLDILSYNQDSNANETYLVTSEKWSSINNWCGMLGYTPTPASPSRFLQVFVLSAVQQSNVTIPKGTIVKTFLNSCNVLMQLVFLLYKIII